MLQEQPVIEIQEAAADRSADRPLTTASRTVPLRVAILGLGYVGLPTALSLHRAGIEVIGIDVDRRRLDAIAAGEVDAASADRHEVLRAVASPTFGLHHDPAAIAEADAVIICVPTPVDHDKRPEISALSSACAAVVEAARPGQVIVLTSTTYVGCTAALLAEPLRARGLEPGRDLHVAFSPERINPGAPKADLDWVPRVVGGVTPSCTDAAAHLIARFAFSVHVVGSAEVAEMAKLVENTFRAVNIALANEFADAARAMGIDPTEALDAAASKPYGFMAFQPGPGIGGHCIPCDPHYLLWRLQAEGVRTPVIEHAMRSLADRPRLVARRVVEQLEAGGRSIAGARVVIAGLAYKPGVEDVRESPSLVLAAELRRRGAVVVAHDPLVHHPVLDVDGVALANVPAPGPDDLDLAVVMVRHPGADESWLDRAPRVLDTTYRMPAHPAVETL